MKYILVSLIVTLGFIFTNEAKATGFNNFCFRDNVRVVDRFAVRLGVRRVQFVEVPRLRFVERQINRNDFRRNDFRRNRRRIWIEA